MSRKILIALALIPLTLTTALIAKDRDEDSRQEPGRKHAVIRFIKGTFSPHAIVMAGAGAGITQATDTPHEWGQGMAGFGRRFGSAIGKHVINYGIHYAVSEARHEEIQYHPSGKTGFRPRLEYALLSTVVTRKTTTGEKTVAAGELSGAFGSGLISRVWQPASTASIGHGIASGGITLGADAGIHVVREFWPEIRHPHKHHTSPSFVSGPAHAAVPANANRN